MRFSPEESFDGRICTRCGRCTLVCPSSAIRPDDGGLPVFDRSACIACGHCAAYCPAGCFGRAAAAGRVPDLAALSALYAMRRSVRFFQDGDLPAEDLAMLLEVVGYCPTGTNACGLSIRVFSGLEARRLHEPVRRLFRILWATGLLRIAGAVAGMTGFLRRFLAGEDLIFRQAPAVLFFFAPRRNPTSRDDGVIAASMVMTASQAMGFGSFWNGVAKLLYPLVPEWKRESGAGRGSRLCAVLCVGKPLFGAAPLPPRDWTLLEGPGAGERRAGRRGANSAS